MAEDDHKKNRGCSVADIVVGPEPNKRLHRNRRGAGSSGNRGDVATARLARVVPSRGTPVLDQIPELESSPATSWRG